MYRSCFEIFRSGFEFYTLARDQVLSSIDESRSVRFVNKFYRSYFERYISNGDLLEYTIIYMLLIITGTFRPF